MQISMLQRESGARHAGRPPVGISKGELQNYIDLLEENGKLIRQVSEMEKFLNDHGLVWVGNGKYFPPLNPTKSYLARDTQRKK